MKTALTLVMAFLCGSLFSIGLAVSGMLNPARVAGFLDVAGAWDPTLMFVLVSAVFSYAAVFWLMALRGRPIVSEQFHPPTSRSVDIPLIIGATIFGVGWGVSGYCPGPAVAGLGFWNPLTGVFVATLLAGMAISGPMRNRMSRPKSDSR